MTGIEKGRKPSRPAQVTVILRLVAGCYLMYLAFGLGKEAIVSQGGRQLLQLGCLALFLAVGALLGGWSLMKLLKGEYIHPGEDEIEDEAEEKAEEE